MENNIKVIRKFRCPICNKLLFKYSGENLKGCLILEIKCVRCNKIVRGTIEGKSA